ncbi:ABC-type transport auxiliary lipoprotein family protein [Lutimaribacter marinistellae]|uniref:ABC-type transport auxiliary lipoprotein family protein n=1 Tax=Lutimaribacter marinistellae TaxID=1820329 RepID=A0ABV7TGZ3_9RHOB
MKARIILVLASSMLLQACAGLGLLNEAAEPNDIYLLTPKSTFAANLPTLRQQLVIEEPTATAAVDTDRIAVQPSPLEVQYLPDARWIDRAPRFVQALLIESFENTGKVGAVGRSAAILRPDFVIVTDMREFQAQVVADGTDSDALDVRVRLNVKIVDDYDDRIIASASFEEITRSETSEMPGIAYAFDEALGDAMRDAVEWTIRSIYKHSGSYPRS